MNNKFMNNKFMNNKNNKCSNKKKVIIFKKWLRKLAMQI